MQVSFNSCTAAFVAGLCLAFISGCTSENAGSSQGRNQILSANQRDLPNDATGDALRRIAADGSDLTRPMWVDFEIAVPSQASGNKIAAKCKELGFRTKVWRDDESDQWTCTCSKTMIPTHADITAIERQFEAIAQPFGGYSVGWVTFGNVDD